MRIHFILVRRVPPVPSPVLLDVAQWLEGQGYLVSGSIPEEVPTHATQPVFDCDLVLLKSHTELALSLAALAHGEGMPLLNPYESCAITQDKVTACRRLAAAGIPVPPTWAVGDLTGAEQLLDDGPIVVKPIRGHRGAGVHVVRDRGELAGITFPPGAALVAQKYIAGPDDGEDLKVYVIGDEVFAVRKPFAPDSFTKVGRPSQVGEVVSAIARRAGEALGLGLYGLDIVEGAEGPFVVDVNYFPGYKGVEGAAPRIARYIDRFARGEVKLEPAGSSQIKGGSPEATRWATSPT